MLPEAPAEFFLGYNSTLLKFNKTLKEALCKLSLFLHSNIRKEKLTLK